MFSIARRSLLPRYVAVAMHTSATNTRRRFTAECRKAAVQEPDLTPYLKDDPEMLRLYIERRKLNGDHVYKNAEIAQMEREVKLTRKDLTELIKQDKARQQEHQTHEPSRVGITVTFVVTFFFGLWMFEDVYSKIQDLSVELNNRNIKEEGMEKPRRNDK